MKNFWKSLMIVLVSVFALASCEDVPAPYPNPDNGENGGGNTNEEVAPAGEGTLENPYNVAGVLVYIEGLGADVESSTAVYVKGKVLSNNTTEATITQYGNMTFDIIDEGNTSKTFKAFQVYGPGNKKFTAVDQIKEGDEVIVYGKVVNYKGNTPETVGKGQAYVVSINDNGNAGGDTPGEEIAPIGDGTAEAPFNVAAALAYIETLGADVESATAVYVKGKVLSNNTTEATITQYGNMTFDIIDEGNTSKTFKAFQVYGPGNQKFTAVSQIKEGDEVIVYGKVVNYKGNTPETVGKGQAYVVSINGNGNTGGDTPGEEIAPTGDGTAEAPFNVAAALAYIETLGADVESATAVYVKGKVLSNNTTEATITQYGNMTFDIIDEGNTSKTFKAFQVYGPGNQKFTAVSQIKVGDEVIVYGKVVNYMGNTPETIGKGQAYVVSINGKEEMPEPGEDNPGGDTPSGDASEYANTISYTAGSNFYDDGVATINGVSDVKVLKIGTSKATGEFTFTSSSDKLTFYAVTWNKASSASVKFLVDDNEVASVTVRENTGAANNSPYTLTVSSEDKYEITIPAGKTIKVTADKRIIFFGMKN